MSRLSMNMESIIPGVQHPAPPTAAGLRDRLARRVVCNALRRLHTGRLTLRDAAGQQQFGSGEGLHAAVTVHDAAFYRRVATGGTLGAGEAYSAGLWSADDLTALLRLMLANAAAFDGLNTGLARLAGPWRRAWNALRRNTRAGSRRNIAAHYDLSNEFYRLWLDETLTYSSGIFERPDSTLADASLAKLDRLCRKLQLSPQDHVLEIGTGWGSFALHAAQRYGCRVTTTTISRQQYELARERIAAAGLADRITLLQDDYRDLRGRYDKLVSIEMIEAVGWEYYDTYFRQLGRLLAPGGAAALQAITIADRYYEAAKREVDFIKRYIFPGSCIPSLAAMASSVARATDLTIAHVEDITPHYATTLRAWHERFVAQLPAVRALGYDETFIRMWRFYLAYCEAGFRERSIATVQMLLVKPQWRGAAPLGAL